MLAHRQFMLALLLALVTALPTWADEETQSVEQQRKKVVFVAGRKSHGYGAHEHNAGCLLLARYLRDNVPNVETVVYQNGWPENGLEAFDGADAVVVYCDGGGGHLLNRHVDEFSKLMDQGIGLACIHYAVEVPKGKSGDAFLNWLGGYFETNWSVNPHWVAEFKRLPEHPILRGVEPFSINDEWYFHMRFRPDMDGVTPILSARAPASTMRRPDGPHSGNPQVRASVARGDLQHVAWALERPQGGRGFGFTGGHFHWNWGDDNFRRVVLNAILWIAHAEVPAGGVGGKTPSREELEANQDEPKPDRNSAASQQRAPVVRARPRKSPAPPAAAFNSGVVNVRTENHSVKIDVDVTGAKKLYLVVRDGGNGFSCDWADWIEPRLVGPGGEKKLTDLQWKSASADWGQVHLNKNCGGGALRVAGKSVSYGIGTHANSVIEYDLPAGFTRFQAHGGLDNGGTDQGGGSQSSVQFLVYTTAPPMINLTGGADRSPDQAVANLDVHPELDVQLFAAEPMLLSPSNIDIDHRGRVWVCEIVNYRAHQGKRPEGDRILILEDTDGDGQADTKKVFYQGNDINSPHGVCVLGNKIIVSSGPHVLCFIDENGDDKPDQKQIWFQGISGVQHDHGIHAFMFGPDGKLYFNFGNEGRQLKDAQGNPVVDTAGNVVAANRQPYQQGMVFRCNEDLSDFETLGWNFRNNWMATVDSFGTIWQSDNDDDGNRGVRINYVMEFGNYGYRDEMSGAGWQTQRIGMASDVPHRHWHANDPGVVPNLLLTGAGSPTGITVYEGDALPSIFHGQLLHCDAGPSVTRAYVVSPHGAGYQAEVVNVLQGARDQWFRPSDVKVAPDGSLIVADWYDPGVGGHRMGDLGRGRLFRVTRRGASDRYQIPRFDFSTPAGAVQALQNPNYAVRYLAFTALHSMQSAAEQELLTLWKSDNPRMQARALWLLGKIKGRSQHYVDLATQSDNANIRIVALRLARQLDDVDPLPVVSQLVNDDSPAVRRECAIALRHDKRPEAARLWALLASQHDGQDRWYLEALGIAADGQWDDFMAAWRERVGDDWNTLAGRDIIWRSRGQSTELLEKLILADSTPSSEIARYLRSLDFLPEAIRQRTAARLAFSTDLGEGGRQQLILGEALSRLGGLKSPSRQDQLARLSEMLEVLRGSHKFIELVDRFNLSDRYDDVLEIAVEKHSEAEGIEAIQLLLAKAQWDRIQSVIKRDDPADVSGILVALGNSADNRAVRILAPLLTDSAQTFDVRRETLRSLAKIRLGAEQLVAKAEAKQLPEDLEQTAAAELGRLPWRDLRNRALKVYPLPSAKGDQPLPSIRDLARTRGQAQLGAKIFNDAGTCAKCHVVNGEGKPVGPELSEIGNKLSREAMFESILYPSAGISHSFETYLVELHDGNVVSGILVSQTDDELELKTNEAVLRRLPKTQVAALTKQPISLMPSDLHKNLTEKDLVDLVEYLTTLKKK